jgi:hypothetical protein
MIPAMALADCRWPIIDLTEPMAHHGSRSALAPSCWLSSWLAVWPDLCIAKHFLYGLQLDDISGGRAGSMGF